MLEYSIVIPVYNEEESLQPLLDEVKEVMVILNRPFEIIFVDDYSYDQSANIMLRFQREYPDIVKVITLDARKGQTFALRTGLDAAKGNFVVTLDADLQNDPEDIPKMITKVEHGYHCVCGWRKARQDTPLKAGFSKTGNVLQRLLTGMKIHDVSCTLRIYKHEVVDKIALNWEGQHRFIPLSLSLQGYKIGEIESHHRQRQFGTTKYSHKRIFRVVVDFFKIFKSGGKK